MVKKGIDISAKMLYDELLNVIERVKEDGEIMESLSDMNGSIIFEVADKGKKLHISVNDGEIIGPLEKGVANADLHLIGNEIDFIKIMKGKLDPDTAYLSGKIKLKGSFFAAVKLKNIIGRINQ